MQGIALVATQDIADDSELFLDYQLNPQVAKRLSWYQPVVHPE
jgi:hypothetical protein